MAALIASCQLGGFDGRWRLQFFGLAGEFPGWCAAARRALRDDMFRIPLRFEMALSDFKIAGSAEERAREGRLVLG